MKGVTHVKPKGVTHVKPETVYAEAKRLDARGKAPEEILKALAEKYLRSTTQIADLMYFGEQSQAAQNARKGRGTK